MLLIDPERRPARWRTCAARQPLPLGCLVTTYLEFLAEQSLHASQVGRIVDVHRRYAICNVHIFDRYMTR
jgi:hypothetical protein